MMDLIMIQKMVEDGFASRKIAKDLHTNPDMIKAIIKDNGFVLKCELFAEDQINHIIELYEAGVSAKALGIKYGIGKRRVQSWAQEKGILRDKNVAHRMHFFNENIFDIIDTAEKAYWLGFLYADAYNSQRKHALSISLKIEDIDHLQKFCQFLNYDASLIQSKITKEGHQYCTIIIRSIHLSEQLAKLGCPQAKSFVLEFPKWMDGKLLPDFIRGIFDGDGSLKFSSRKEWNWSIIGTLSICNGIRDIFILNNISNKPQPHYVSETGHNTWVIEYSGNLQVRKICDLIYYNSNNHSRLARKYNLYLQLQEQNKSQHSDMYNITNKYNDPNNYGTCYIPTFNNKQLTTDNLKIMSEQEKQVAAEQLLDFYRSRGFPYPILSNDEIFVDLMRLKKFDTTNMVKDNIIVLKNITGIPTFKHFSPHFYEVNSNLTTKKSMLDTFNDDNLLLKVIKNRLKQNYSMTGNMLKQGLPNSKTAFKASIFYPTLAKFIYEKYCRENDIIYDYSMGFGQRLMGALSLPYKIKYIGADPLDKTVESNKNIFNFHQQYITDFNKEAEFHCVGSEIFCEEQYFNKVNVAFSSPPYWNIEKYCNDGTQATNYGYVDFINIWWKKVVSNIDKLLTEDGFFILNVEEEVCNFDIRKDMENIVLGAGFLIIDEYKMQISKNTVFNNANGQHKYEPIIVFKRK